MIKLIYCVELNKYFKTTTEAQKETGVDSSSISKACRGIRASAGKHPKTNQRLHWEYREMEVNA